MSTIRRWSDDELRGLAWLMVAGAAWATVTWLGMARMYGAAMDICDGTHDIPSRPTGVAVLVMYGAGCLVLAWRIRPRWWALWGGLGALVGVWLLAFFYVAEAAGC